MDDIRKTQALSEFKDEISKILETEDWEFSCEVISKDSFTNCNNYSCNLSYKDKLWNIKTVAATFKLRPMIGCCGICVVTEMSIYPLFARDGLDTVLFNLGISLAKVLGYTKAFCTDNGKWERSIKKSKWEKQGEFVNKRTAHLIGIYTAEL